MRKFLSVLFIIAFSQAVLAQKKPPSSITPCNLTLKDLPKFRGFYLGQPVKEFALLFPNFEAIYKKKMDGGIGASIEETGEVKIDSYQFFYGSNYSGRIEFREDYKDVNLSWSFLDDKLIWLVVNYEEYEPSSIKDFINQLAKTVGFPVEFWRIENRDAASLKCNGFSVDIWTGRYEQKPDYVDYPSLIIKDLNAEVEIERRSRIIKQAAADLKRKEILLQKERERQERENRRVFKP